VRVSAPRTPDAQPQLPSRARVGAEARCPDIATRQGVKCGTEWQLGNKLNGGAPAARWLHTPRRGYTMTPRATHRGAHVRGAGPATDRESDKAAFLARVGEAALPLRAPADLDPGGRPASGHRDRWFVLLRPPCIGRWYTGARRAISAHAIGVVYDPKGEAWGNYVPTLIPRRYDAFLFVERSQAVDPLHVPVQVAGEPGETYPTGM
jgi:hypothetical protein